MEQQPTLQEDSPLANEHYLSLVGDVEVNCIVRLGSLQLTIHELGQLKVGQLLALQEKTDDPVDVLFNNHVIARGHLMNCDDYFAIQITEISQ
jgi:flagellar motor switch protein FliN/FliY